MDEGVSLRLVDPGDGGESRGFSPPVGPGHVLLPPGPWRREDWLQGSAIVSAVTATSDGNTLTSMLSRSMTTDVPSTPCSARWPGTGFDAVIGEFVEIALELFAVDGWSCLEDRCDGVRCHEAEVPK